MGSKKHAQEAVGHGTEEFVLVKIQIPKELHAQLIKEAEARNISLNEYICEILAKHVPRS